ncbi:MAG TPA: hypothetical protein VEQ60_27190, partial [Longimicrobium sp.]|nr:hypothetical protein [Longimicrobium sp.]
MAALDTHTTFSDLPESPEMLTISTQPRPLDDPDEYYSERLLVNGELIPDSIASYSDDNRVFAYLYDADTPHVLAKYTLGELQTHFV